MLVSALTPEPGNKVRFAHPSVKLTPEQPGCYVLTTIDLAILYIGQSVNLSRRMEQHLEDPEKRSRAVGGIAFWFYYTECANRDLDSIERGWINDFSIREGCLPFFNKIRPPV